MCIVTSLGGTGVTFRRTQWGQWFRQELWKFIQLFQKIEGQGHLWGLDLCER